MICPEKYIQYHWFYSSLQKAMHLGSNPSLDHCGPNGNDARFITKAFCRDILGAHYRQPDLKVWLTLLMIKSFVTIHILLSEKILTFYLQFTSSLQRFYPLQTQKLSHSLFSFAQRSLTNSKEVDKNNLSGSVLVKMLCSFLQQKLFIV